MDHLLLQNGYKQTAFDHQEEEDGVNNSNNNHSTTEPIRNARIKIIDKPIPLDSVVHTNSSAMPDDSLQARYQRLKETRDKLFAQKKQIRPTPVAISPKKKKDSTREKEQQAQAAPYSMHSDITAQQDTEELFEPVSTKVFPSSKQREERIKILRKMIYKADQQSQKNRQQGRVASQGLDESASPKPAASHSFSGATNIPPVSLPPPSSSPAVKPAIAPKKEPEEEVLPELEPEHDDEHDEATTQDESNYDDSNTHSLIDDAIAKYETMKTKHSHIISTSQPQHQIDNEDPFIETIDQKLIALENKINDLNKQIHLLETGVVYRGSSFTLPTKSSSLFTITCFIMFLLLSYSLAD